VKALSEAKRENTLEGRKAQESTGCLVRVIPDGVRTDLSGDQIHEGEPPAEQGACKGARHPPAVTPRWDGEPEGGPISTRGTLCRAQNPMSVSGMKQGRDGQRRNKALRG